MLHPEVARQLARERIVELQRESAEARLAKVARQGRVASRGTRRSGLRESLSVGRLRLLVARLVLSIR